MANTSGISNSQITFTGRYVNIHSHSSGTNSTATGLANTSSQQAIQGQESISMLPPMAMEAGGGTGLEATPRESVTPVSKPGLGMM